MLLSKNSPYIKVFVVHEEIPKDIAEDVVNEIAVLIRSTLRTLNEY